MAIKFMEDPMSDIQFKTNQERRDFILKATTLVPAGLALLASTKIQAQAPGGALKFVSDADPTAKALKYVADATKAKREKRGTTEGKDQSCSNCQLYTKQGEIGGKEAGKCLMIQAGMVAAGGWCNSWVKKA
jgi:hypothetical protein